jgi:hypothetical protein
MATIQSFCHNHDCHDGKGPRSLVTKFQAAIADGLPGLLLTEQKLKNLSGDKGEAGTKSDFIACFGTLAACDQVLGMWTKRIRLQHDTNDCAGHDSSTTHEVQARLPRRD